MARTCIQEVSSKQFSELSEYRLSAEELRCFGARRHVTVRGKAEVPLCPPHHLGVWVPVRRVEGGPFPALSQAGGTFLVGGQSQGLGHPIQREQVRLRPVWGWGAELGSLCLPFLRSSAWSPATIRL